MSSKKNASFEPLLYDQRPQLVETPAPDSKTLRSFRFLGLFTPKRLAVLIVVLLLTGLALSAIHRTAQRMLLEEVRYKVMQLAELLASQIDPADVEKIQQPLDMERPEFQRILDSLQQARKSYRDIAFIYILRRNPQSHQWYFVIDAQPFDVDHNQDGVIEPGEEGVQPGLLYEEGVNLPEIATALHSPTAREEFYTDYYGTFMSGYAPIGLNGNKQGVAVLAVDIQEATFKSKARAITLTTLFAFGILLVTLILLISAFYGKTDALEVAQELENKVEEQIQILQEKNTTLKDTIEQLRHRERIYNEELHLAQEIQLHFLPQTYPYPDRLCFASYYQACEEIGGDLFDVFTIQDGVAGIYIADVSGHGASAALVTAALKASIERFRQAHRQSPNYGTPVSNPETDQTLAHYMKELNRAMLRIIPPGHFLTFQIAIIDTLTGEMMIANAGHPQPLLWQAENKQAINLTIDPNFAIGFVPEATFKIARIKLNPSDKILFYTDGLVERFNPERKEFGLERLLQAMQESGDFPPQQLLDRIMHIVNQFAQGLAPHDDNAALVMEWLGPVD